MIPTIEFAHTLKEEGRGLYILTIACSEGEKMAKHHFLHEHKLNELFDQIIFCTDPLEKTAFILNFAENNGLQLSDCMLIEDYYATAIHAHNAGIQAIYVSNIIAGNISC